MAKTLILFRHAKSSWDYPGLDDFERPLNDRGARACAIMAEYIRKQGLAPDLVLASSAARVRETLCRVTAALGADWEIAWQRGLYMADQAAVLAAVRGAPESAVTVMMVGHNPDIGALASTLAGKDPDPFGKFPTAALAIFECDIEAWRDLTPAACTLVDYATPKELARS
jgi:phosphohistidine phosphatase